MFEKIAVLFWTSEELCCFELWSTLLCMFLIYQKDKLCQIAYIRVWFCFLVTNQSVRTYSGRIKVSRNLWLSRFCCLGFPDTELLMLVPDIPALLLKNWYLIMIKSGISNGIISACNTGRSRGTNKGNTLEEYHSSCTLCECISTIHKRRLGWSLVFFVKYSMSSFSNRGQMYIISRIWPC